MGFVFFLILKCMICKCFFYKLFYIFVKVNNSKVFEVNRRVVLVIRNIGVGY